MHKGIFSKIFEDRNFHFFLVFIFSFLHGCLYFYPDFVQNFNSSEKLSYFTFHDGIYNASSDELIYGGHIRRYYDFFKYGHLNFKNPTSLNGNSSVNYQSIAYIFGGFCSYILGGVEKFFHLKNFIFPFVGYLVSFFLLKAIFKSFYISLIGAVFIYNPLFALTDVLNYFTLNSNIWEDSRSLSYLAIKYPAGQFTLPIYFFGLLSLFKILEDKDYKFLLIFSMTISAYSYVYSFVALGFITLCLFLYAWIYDLKSKRDLFISGLVSLVLALPLVVTILQQEFKDDLLMSLYFTKTQNFPIDGYLFKSLIIVFISVLISRFFGSLYKNLVPLIISQLILLIFFYYFTYHFLIIPEPQHFILNYHFSKILFLIMILNIIMNLKGGRIVKILKTLSFTSFASLSIFFLLTVGNFQLKDADLKKDLHSNEYREIINWVNKETPSYSTLLTLDPFLLNTIPVLTGRYNYIISLKTVSATSMSSTVKGIENAKIILKLNDKFEKFLNKGCTFDESQKSLITLCQYFFHSYFYTDKGSLSYKKRGKFFPEKLVVPEKNLTGKNIYYSKVNLKNNYHSEYSLPEYIIIGPIEKKFIVGENNFRNYKKIYNTRNYEIFELN